MPLYKDEDILGDLFCESRNCTECVGIDHNGEPNGYGCEGRDDFIEANAESLVENSREDIYYTQTKLNKSVQDEREACALSINEFVKEQRKIKAKSVFPEFDAGFEACMTLLTERAEAIRARTK